MVFGLFPRKAHGVSGVRNWWVFLARKFPVLRANLSCREVEREITVAGFDFSSSVLL